MNQLKIQRIFQELIYEQKNHKLLLLNRNAAAA